MKIQKVVEFKFHNAYTGWNCLELNDADENQVKVKMTDDDYLSFADTLVMKANRIRKERADEAAEAVRAQEAKGEDE